MNSIHIRLEHTLNKLDLGVALVQENGLSAPLLLRIHLDSAEPEPDASPSPFQPIPDVLVHYYVDSLGNAASELGRPKLEFSVQSETVMDDPEAKDTMLNSEWTSVRYAVIPPSAVVLAGGQPLSIHKTSS
jgi:hypothetical protein